jgi:hypothetical protein
MAEWQNCRVADANGTIIPRFSHYTIIRFNPQQT